MRKLLLLLLLISNSIWSQSNLKFSRPITTTTLPTFSFTQEEIREHVFSIIPINLIKETNERSLLKFADEVAMDNLNDLSNGQIYGNWHDLEDYLNKIVKSLLIDDLKNDKYIHAYICKDPSVNASTSPSGIINVNIGLFNCISNEASLAAVLAHELAHYYLKHTIKEFLLNESGKFDYGLFSDTKLRNKYSIKYEIEADSLALIWMNKAGYNLNGMLKLQEAFMRNEKNSLKSISGIFELKETTHPSSEKRYNRAKQFIEKHTLDSAIYNSIDEPLLNKFKEECKLEILKENLDRFQYSECIENAFIYHMFDPENSIYYYYMMEGIRRYCFFDTKHWAENFITNNYYTTVISDDSKVKVKMDLSLLEKFDLEVLPIDPLDGKKVKVRHYWKDAPLFKTYEQAFLYFYGLGVEANNPECILSNALSLGSDTIPRNEMLKSYLSFSNIRYREYARFLLNDSIYKCLASNKLYVFSMFHYDVLQGSNHVCMGRASHFKNGIINKTLHYSLKKDSISNSILLDDLKETNLQEYLALDRMERISYSAIVRLYKNFDLIYIDPEFWELFRKYNVDQILFRRFKLTARCPKNNTIAGLRTILNIDPEDMLFNVKEVKYLNWNMSEFKIKKNRFTTKLTIGEEITLDKNKETKYELEKYLKGKIIVRDEY